MGLYSLEGEKIGKLGEIWERIKIIRVIGKFYLLGGNWPATNRKD